MNGKNTAFQSQAVGCIQVDINEEEDMLIILVDRKEPNFDSQIKRDLLGHTHSPMGSSNRRIAMSIHNKTDCMLEESYSL